MSNILQFLFIGYMLTGICLQLLNWYSGGGTARGLRIAYLWLPLLALQGWRRMVK